MKKEPNPYITDCRKCGFVTSKAYAEAHRGTCRPCTTGEERKAKDQRTADSYWNERI